MIKEYMNKPFKLKPVGKDYLWGGNRLNTEFNKNIDMYPLAETWECSIHPDGESIIDTGIYKGQKLSKIIKENPNFLGVHNETGNIPILIKLIDAKKNLSVQVHPSDEYANEFENGSLGKSEMWYVLDANKDAKLIYGFKHDVTKEELIDALNNNDLESKLHTFNVKKGDTFFIDSGRVHAIGKGILIAEIQESSNLTYRLYDYNRKDKNGNKRELHINKSLDVLNLEGVDKMRVPMHIYNYNPFINSESICRCKYFEVSKDTLKSDIVLQNDDLSFKVMLIIDGEGELSFANESLKLKKGDTIFIPASSVEYKLTGKFTFLNINC